MNGDVILPVLVQAMFCVSSGEHDYFPANSSAVALVFVCPAEQNVVTVPVSDTLPGVDLQIEVASATGDQDKE